MAEFADMIENDYSIERKRVTTRNPQANSIIERAHQSLSAYIFLDEDDPWSGILAVTMFAMRSTVHHSGREIK